MAWRKPGRVHFRARKRRQGTSSDGGFSGVELEEFFRDALTLQPAACVYDSDYLEDKLSLAVALWSPATLLGADSLTSANTSLASVLEVLIRKCGTADGEEELGATETRTAIRLEGLITNLQRALSQKQMTLITARVSMAAARCQLHGRMWRMMSLLSPGLLASETWTEDFMVYARNHRPPCSYEELPLVGGTMFDNYTRKVLYKSQVTVEKHGFMLHMTNWGSFVIPAMLASPNFDANVLCKFIVRRESVGCRPLHVYSFNMCANSVCVCVCAVTGRDPFRPISMAGFTAKFLISNPEVLANKRKRFTDYLLKSAAGILFERPGVTPPYVAHLTYGDPIWGKLQSSYEDVEDELNEMREKHLDKRILFVGGDGLSILRMNHLLYQKPHLYIDSAPMIIPVQGEAPHGVFHVMHGGWRLFARFIRRAADETLGLDQGKAVVDDPTVKHFNTAIYALWWMTRACSEYLLMLARTAGAVDIDQVPEFILACEKNIDLAWVVHFLYDFAYLVLDFKQGVRANQSRHLDVLWREFFTTGYTGTAHKTQYVPMAIMRIFWADALVPPLANLYHNLRAIPMSDRVYVGWDTPIEWLNGAITDGVRSLVSEPRIEEFVRNYSFLDANYAAMLDVMASVRSGAPDKAHYMRDMDSNVDCMKAWLIEKVGADWAEATRANINSELGIGRGTPPWEEMRTTMSQAGKDAVPAFVARHVRDLTNSFYRFR